MSNKILKILCMLLTVCLLLLSLPACQEVDPLAGGGIESMVIDEDNNVQVEAVIDARTLGETGAETAYLFELLPGETSIEGKPAIASADVEHRISFEFPLTENQRSRLYSSFVVALSDGTLITPEPCWIDNPQILASNTEDFLWQASPKGLNTADVFHSFELGSMHVMLKSSLMELTDPNGALSAGACAALDRQIKAATDSGMQVSLTLAVNRPLPANTMASFLHALSARYAGGEYGCVSALFLPMNPSNDNAWLCRVANQAIRSHVANGRVYMLSNATDTETAKAEFFTLANSLGGGELSWGAALVPSDSTASWNADENGLINTASIKSLASYLLTNYEVGADWLAMCDVTFPKLSDDEQAASYAYQYRVALDAGVSLHFYGKHFDDATGLFTSQRYAKPIASVFETVDCGLSPRDLAFCQEIAGTAWNDAKLSGFQSREQVTGVASVGASGLEEEMWIDFSRGSTNGFFAVNSRLPATHRESQSLGGSAFCATVRCDEMAQGGMRRFFESSEALANATTLSVKLLTQGNTENCRVFLTLEGENSAGARISYSSESLLSVGTWQILTFQISSFTSDLNTEAPCVLTVSVEPEGGSAGEMTLWLRSLKTRCPSDDSGYLLLYILLLSGIVIAFAASLLIYKWRSSRNNSHRGNQKRGRRS